jgi:nanoRNase/pAp phosphatase (c-di-AMP/oligoRNAs hydrolase)
MDYKGFPYIKGKKAVILIHRQADVDAIASAAGLKEILRAKGFKVKIPRPSGVSQLAKGFSERIGFKFDELTSLRSIDLIIIADTGNPELLEGFVQKVRRSKAFKVLIDHHPYDPAYDEMINRKLVDTESSSTSEIVFRLFRILGVPVDRKLATILLAGILFDSQHLHIVRCKTLKEVTSLCRLAGGIDEARGLLRHTRDRSEVIARLKAGQRAKLYRFGEWILVTSKLSSFQSSAARYFIDAGSDISIVLGEDEEGSRASMRSSQSFYKETGLHLGSEVARVVGERLRGVGGGHPTAASIKSKRGIDELEKEILRELESRLRIRLEEMV